MTTQRYIVTKMNNGKKSGKLLIVGTVLTIVALASVLVVFAAVLGTFNGNAVTVNDVASGTVKYSSDGTTGWGTDMSAFNVTGSWYAKFELSTTSYPGPATVTWHLQKDTSGWANVGSVTTTVTLTGSSQTIFASDDGTSTGNLTPNHDWGADISTGGSYRIVVTVASG